MNEQTLKANADRIEKQTFMRKLMDPEYEKVVQDFARVATDIKVLEEEFKAVKDDFKDRLKPLQQQFQYHLSVVRTHQIQVTEEVYLIADHESGMMETYSKDGELILSRRLTPEEKQTRMSLHKAINE